MSSYVVTDRSLALRLAEVLGDLDVLPPAGMSYADIAYQVLAGFTEQKAARPNVEPDVVVKPYVLSAETMARCQEAGRRLGASNVDFRGNPAGVPCAPAPSRSAKLRALADASLPR